MSEPIDQVISEEAWDTPCPKRDDKIHCTCWYDGEPCCACGAPGLSEREKNFDACSGDKNGMHCACWFKDKPCCHCGLNEPVAEKVSDE